MSESTDPTRIPKTLLEAAGLAVPPADLQDISQSYPGLRANADTLWLPETRYAEPALLFAADPGRDDD